MSQEWTPDRKRARDIALLNRCGTRGQRRIAQLYLAAEPPADELEAIAAQWRLDRKREREIALLARCGTRGRRIIERRYPIETRKRPTRTVNMLAKENSRIAVLAAAHGLALQRNGEGFSAARDGAEVLRFNRLYQLAAWIGAQR